MKYNFKLENTGAIQATLSMTMSLSDWTNLKEQLDSGSYPSWKLINAIIGMIHKANQEYTQQEEYA